MSNRGKSSLFIFAVLCLAALVGLGGYFALIRSRGVVPVESMAEPGVEVPKANSAPVSTPVPPSRALPSESVPKQVRSAGVPKRILFRNTALGAHYGSLAFYDLPIGQQLPQVVSGLACEVVYFAGGQGICLTADRGVFTTYAAVLFDETFARRFTIPLQGVPSRCRMSMDGKVSAVTVFLTGHSYTSLDFTTQTLLVDTATGAVISDLEKFEITRAGVPFRAKDFNFWGVTFSPDSKQFYCTLSSDRKHYLIKGDIRSRTASVVHENVECPSLSPDGSRIAYKKRSIAENRLYWQLHTLDVATGRETPLAEKRSVDDQLEWLDNSHVLYALPESDTGAGTNVWQINVEAGGKDPVLFLPKAYSPTVIR